MASKGYNRFENRLVKFREDCEMAQVVVTNKEILKDTQRQHVFARMDEELFPLLSERQDSPYCRKLIVTHLRKTVYVAFIKELYEEVTEYFRYILREASRSGVDPNRLIGDNDINIKANDILSKSNKKEIAQMIVEQIYRKLEKKAKTAGTISLIDNIKNKLGLNIDENVINSALPYLECRHIFVHADGKADNRFRESHPNIAIDNKGRIVLNPNFINEAYNQVHALVRAFDLEMEERNYFTPSEIHLAPAEPND